MRLGSQGAATASQMQQSQQYPLESLPQHLLAADKSSLPTPKSEFRPQMACQLPWQLLSQMLSPLKMWIRPALTEIKLLERVSLSQKSLQSQDRWQ